MLGNPSDEQFEEMTRLFKVLPKAGQALLEYLQLEDSNVAGKLRSEASAETLYRCQGCASALFDLQELLKGALAQSQTPRSGPPSPYEPADALQDF